MVKTKLTKHKSVDNLLNTVATFTHIYKKYLVLCKQSYTFRHSRNMGLYTILQKIHKTMLVRKTRIVTLPTCAAPSVVSPSLDPNSPLIVSPSSVREIN